MTLTKASLQKPAEPAERGGNSRERSFWKAWTHIASWREQEVDALKAALKQATFCHWRTRKREIRTGAIYCECCEMWINGPTQYEDHKLGKKHRKNSHPPSRRPETSSTASSTGNETSSQASWVDGAVQESYKKPQPQEIVLKGPSSRMNFQLLSDKFKVLVWGVAIPYNYYVFAKERHTPIEEMIQEELRVLYHGFLIQRGVVMILPCPRVIQPCPLEDTVADEGFAVSEMIRDTFVAMKRAAVTSALHGAKWKGQYWADEKYGICEIMEGAVLDLGKVEGAVLDLMYDASCEIQAPYTWNVPCPNPVRGSLTDDDGSFLESLD